MMLARALGLYESEKTKAVITLLRPGQTFVDVGSNKGDFSLLASKRVGTVGKVLSFEPEPTNCGWIRKSVDLNRYHNISLFEMALSDTNGEERLYLGEKSGHHTLLPGRPNRTGAAITVQKKTLDAVLDELDHPRIHMIKIDVEGAELEVLRGASDTLVTNPGIIVLLDIHPQLGVDPNEICDFLEGLGFSLFRMQSPFDIPAQREARLNELLACRGAPADLRDESVESRLHRQHHLPPRAGVILLVVAQPGNRWAGHDPQEASLQSVILSRLLRAGAVGELHK